MQADAQGGDGVSCDFPPEREQPELSPVRMLALAGMVGLGYLTMPWWVHGGQSGSPALLIVFALGGAAAGAVAGVVEAARSRDGSRTSRRSTPSAVPFVVGTTGGALLLGRVLDLSAIPWVLLVMSALATGLSVHVWVRARQSPSQPS